MPMAMAMEDAEVSRLAMKPRATRSSGKAQVTAPPTSEPNGWIESQAATVRLSLPALWILVPGVLDCSIIGSAP